MLSRIDTDPAMVKEWLLKSFRVHVGYDEGVGEKKRPRISRIDIL